MRPYRGKPVDKKYGKWVYGWWVKINNTHYIVLDKGSGAVNCGEDSCFYISAFQNFIEVIPETVGQSTGEKDIYEDDIVKVFQMTVKGEMVTVGVGVVVFGQGRFYVQYLNNKCSSDLFNNIEIIGNKWDNKNLLDTKTEK